MLTRALLFPLKVVLWRHLVEFIGNFKPSIVSQCAFVSTKKKLLTWGRGGGGLFCEHLYAKQTTILVTTSRPVFRLLHRPGDRAKLALGFLCGLRTVTAFSSGIIGSD